MRDVRKLLTVVTAGLLTVIATQETIGRGLELNRESKLELKEYSFTTNKKTKLYDKDKLDPLLKHSELEQNNTGVVLKLPVAVTHKELDSLISTEAVTVIDTTELLKKENQNRTVFPISGPRTITSPFGVARTIGYYQDVHNGVDFINGDNNTPVKAYKAGVVVSTAPDSAGGLGVVLKHADGLYSYYWHLQTGSISVKDGQLVEAGTKLGLIGTTGISTGTHLHFGISKNYWADYVDPLLFLKEATEE